MVASRSLDGRVCVGSITAGNFRAEYTASIITTLDTIPSTSWLCSPSGPYLDMGRNQLVQQYFNLLDTERTEYLLMVDSDIEWTPDDIATLVHYADGYHDRQGIYPLVGGVYQGMYEGVFIPIAYRWKAKGDGKVLRPIPLARAYAATTPYPVDAFGTGFMLIHRTLLAHLLDVFPLPMSPFAEMVLPHIDPDKRNIGTWFGEDLIFCMRAKELGYPVLLHRGVRLAHYKTLGLRE